MIKQEYKRYLRSKGNIIILFLSVVPIVVSYYTTWLEKMDWIRQYQNPGSDISDAEGFLTLANGYNCFTYLSEFLFSSDFMVFFLWIMLIGFAAVSGTVLYSHCRNGYGNLLVSRIGFKKYQKNVLIAQNLYILTIMGIQFVLLVGVTFVLLPPAENEYFVTALTLYDTTNSVSQLFVLIKQYMVMVIYVLLVMDVTLFSGCVLSNRYIIQFLPIMIYLVPGLIISVMETFYYPLAEKLLLISPNEYLFSYYGLFIEEQDIWGSILDFGVMPAIFLTAIIVLYKCSSRLQRDYI